MTREKATYLLLKRGLFYRPNDAGYTGIKAEAGRYTLAEGEELKDCGVTYVHEDDAEEFSPSCWDDIKLAHRTSERDTLRAENERLTGAYEASQEAMVEWKQSSMTATRRAFDAEAQIERLRAALRDALSGDPFWPTTARAALSEAQP